MSKNSYQKLGIAVLKTEADAINALIDRIDHKFNVACEMILACKGRIVVTGMGKSGHIGNKIAATLASTGTPAFFMHPGEASHGDLGMITEQDLVIALSNSGEVAEIITLLPLLKRLPVPLISLTGNNISTLAEMADISIDKLASLSEIDDDELTSSFNEQQLVKISIGLGMKFEDLFEKEAEN